MCLIDNDLILGLGSNILIQYLGLFLYGFYINLSQWPGSLWRPALGLLREAAEGARRSGGMGSPPVIKHGVLEKAP